jgi:Domain of unknown function (DUF2703)
VVKGWTTMTNLNAHPHRLRIELLFLDLTTCTRCRGADRSLEAALDLVRDELKATGTEIEVDRFQVESAEQARELHFESSPTIRVNGRDIALELRESSCGSDACTDGCDEQIACRVWVHRGGEYTEPPASMIVDAILREVYAGDAVEHPADAQPYVLPENLERFFAVKGAVAPRKAACCSGEEQRSCCGPAEKAECCGAPTGGGCGCR